MHETQDPMETVDERTAVRRNRRAAWGGRGPRPPLRGGGGGAAGSPVPPDRIGGAGVRGASGMPAVGAVRTPRGAVAAGRW